MTKNDAENVDSTWSSLFKVGGAAAMLCALMYIITLVVYVPANLANPPPETVLEWFEVFEASPVTGLFFLGLGDVVIMILWVPMSLGLFAALKQINRTWSLIATMFVLVGVAIFIATNTAFSMLSLSQEYAFASTEVEKSILLAAGQAMLAITRGTGHLYTGMNLVWLAGLILSVVMLRSKATSTGEVSAIQSIIVAVQYVGGGLLSLAWYILVGLRLWKLGQHGLSDN
jgi:hypothetical protein